MANLYSKILQTELKKTQIGDKKGLKNALNINLQDVKTNKELKDILIKLELEGNRRLARAAKRKSAGKDVGMDIVTEFSARIKKKNEYEYGFHAFKLPENMNRASLEEAINTMRYFLNDERTTEKGLQKFRNEVNKELYKLVTQELGYEGKMTQRQRENLGIVMDALRNKNVIEKHASLFSIMTYNDILAEVGKFVLQKGNLVQKPGGGLTEKSLENLDEFVENLMSKSENEVKKIMENRNRGKSRHTGKAFKGTKVIG